jgi:GH15 family glucan-1,4-alpha-glucosidase
VLVLVRRGAHPRQALDEARLAFEKMLTYANHLSLYAEQISRTGQQQGNFPRR